MVNDVHLYMYTSKCLNRRTLPSDLLDLYVPMFIGRTRKCDTISGSEPLQGSHQTWLPGLATW